MEEKKPDKNGDKEEPLPTLDLLNADEDMIDDLINKLHALEFQLAVIKTTIKDELTPSPSTDRTTSQDQIPSTSTNFPPVQFTPNFNPVFTVSPEMKQCAIPCTSPRSILTEPVRPSGSTDNSNEQQPSSSGTPNQGDGPQVKSARSTWGPPRLIFPLQAPTPREDEQNPNEETLGENPDEGFVENNPDENTEEPPQASNPMPSTPKTTPFDVLGPFPFLHYPAQRFRANFNPIFTVSPEMQQCAIPCSPRSILTKPARPASVGYSGVKQRSTSGRLSTGDAPERSTRRPSWISPNLPLSARTPPRQTPRIVGRRNVQANNIPEQRNDQQNSEQRSADEASSGRNLVQNIPAEVSEEPDEESTEPNLEEEFVECIAEFNQGNQDERYTEDIPDEEFIEATDDGSLDHILGESAAPTVDEKSLAQNPDIGTHERVCENSNPGPSNQMPSDCSTNAKSGEKQFSKPGPSTADAASQTAPTRRAKWGPPSLPILLQVTTPRFTPRLVWQTLEEEDGDDYEADIIEGDTHEDAEAEPEPEAEPEAVPEPEVEESSDEDLSESDEDSLSSTDSSDSTDDISTPPSDTDDEFDYA